MLRRLTVANLAVIEKAEADFCSGLNVITGETGAGKSVLASALGLVLGGRADASIVRDGAREAEAEALFEEDGRQTSLRRTVTAEGRSRAWVDDESVSISELRERGRALVDIHGPQSNRLLVEPHFQKETLDLFGGIALDRYAVEYSAFAETRAKLEALEADDGGQEADLLRFQVGELEEANLSEGDETIAERHAAAAHAEDIILCANEATEALGGDGGIAQSLAALRPKFAAIAKHMPAAEEWATEAEELVLRTQELSRTIADAASALDGGDEDLEALDRRLAVINRLQRKYPAKPGEENTVTRLIELASAKRARLDELDSREERLADLRRELASAEGKVRRAGAALTKVRAAAAKRLSVAVTAELHDLGFLKARFFVELRPSEPTADGMDDVVYMFEPNPGEPAHPLADIASSGEMARVMLALKVASGASTGEGRACGVGAQTLVFDEIDANIGGEVGKIVGEKMREVAKGHQVIAITHLPQSAAYGERHLVVSKTVSGGRTRTRVEPVEGGARVAEMARMLGGEKLTSVVRKHAEELLQISR